MATVPPRTTRAYPRKGSVCSTNQAENTERTRMQQNNVAHQLDTHNQQHTFTTQVRKVLGAMLAVDPRERINMKIVALSLRHPGLWARTTTGLRAAASADAPGLPGASAAVAASPSPGDGSGKTSLDFKPLPESAHTLLSVLDEAANHDMVFTADGQVVPGDRAEVPSWLEVEMARKDGAWWQNVPIPTALVRKGPRRQFRV